MAEHDATEQRSDASVGPDVAGGPTAEVRAAYWKANITYLAVLLTIWAVVSYGAGILLVEPLNRLSLGGAPLGFWFAQQGSIYTFVVLIAVYVVLMNRLDRRFGLREE